MLHLVSTEIASSRIHNFIHVLPYYRKDNYDFNLDIVKYTLWIRIILKLTMAKKYRGGQSKKYNNTIPGNIVFQ